MTTPTRVRMRPTPDGRARFYYNSWWIERMHDRSYEAHPAWEVRSRRTTLVTGRTLAEVEAAILRADGGTP